jgi:hypothetical protein
MKPNLELSRNLFSACKLNGAKLTQRENQKLLSSGQPRVTPSIHLPRADLLLGLIPIHSQIIILPLSSTNLTKIHPMILARGGNRASPKARKEGSEALSRSRKGEIHQCMSEELCFANNE